MNYHLILLIVFNYLKETIQPTTTWLPLIESRSPVVINFVFSAAHLPKILQQKQIMICVHGENIYWLLHVPLVSDRFGSIVLTSDVLESN